MKIKSISAALYGFDGELDWVSPISIRIEFSDNFGIRIRCAGDGESIAMDDQSLAGPVNMEEAGRIEVHPLNDRCNLPASADDIDTVKHILDDHDVIVGLALMSNDSPILCLWNYGDELRYGSFANMLEFDWRDKPRISGTALALK
jgi:hypothetical protein